MSKNRASCFITGSKYLETDESTRPLSSVSQYLEPVIKHEARVFDILHERINK